MAETPKMVRMERVPGSGLASLVGGAKENKTSCIEDFMVNIAGKNCNPFDPRGNTKIKISHFDDDDEGK
jgi:hypothetical protein